MCPRHVRIGLAILQFEHSLAWPFFGIGMKTELFQSCGHWWVFQICWLIECSTLTVSSFRIWNSSTGIPSPLLAWFIVMIPKAHLTSHSRMFGSSWVITPSWLSGSWSSFFFLFLVNFVIHWNETAMGLHEFPIPIPPHTSLSTRSP